MDSTIQNNKKMIFPSPGVDQLGTQVGQAMPGDLVKFHMVASYSAMRPKFKIAGKKFGAERMRTEEYLSTPIVGSTAFIEISIPPTPIAVKKSVVEFLAPYAQTMTLGETAEFFFDFKSLDEKTKNLFFQEVLKGQYKSLPTDAQSITIVLDCFRIVRSDLGKQQVEYRRPNRNGNGAKAFGSYM